MNFAFPCALNQKVPSCGLVLEALDVFNIAEDSVPRLLTPESLVSSSTRPHPTSLMSDSYELLKRASGLDFAIMHANELAIST